MPKPELRRGHCYRCGEIRDVVQVRTVDGLEPWCERCSDVDASKWPAWARLLAVLGFLFVAALVTAIVRTAGDPAGTVRK